MSKRTREERESIATPQKIDIKRRKSEDEAVGEDVNATPTKPETGIKWIPSAEEQEDGAKQVDVKSVTEAKEDVEAGSEETKATVTKKDEQAEKPEDVAKEDSETTEPKKTDDVTKTEAGLNSESGTAEPKKTEETTESESKDPDSNKLEDENKPVAKDSITPQETATKEESKTESKPANGAILENSKPVFGSSSKFSGGFGAFTGGSLWGKPKPSGTTNTDASTSTPSVATSATATGSSGYVFGSSTKFSGGFSSILNNLKKDDDKKSENPWAGKKDATQSGETSGTADEPFKEGSSAANEESGNEDGKEKKEKDAELYIGVGAPLAKKETVETGEEGEECVYTCRAKLYFFDLTNPTEGWKERGVGQVHVNRLRPEDATGAYNGRVVMRTDAVHRVVLNMALVKGLDVQAGMGASLSGDKVVRISTMEDSKPVQYALKTGNPDAAKQLMAGIKGLIPPSD